VSVHQALLAEFATSGNCSGWQLPLAKSCLAVALPPFECSGFNR
jgi:hypothetical protein